MSTLVDNRITSSIKNWCLVTERDFLAIKYGYAMSRPKWEYYTGEGKKISKEQHLAFEVGLETGERFYPKAEYSKSFCISGYAKRYGFSRGGRSVLRENGEVGDIILTSNLMWIEKKDGVVYVSTISGSIYILEGMVRGKEYIDPRDTGIEKGELMEIMNKFFTFKEEVIAS